MSLLLVCHGLMLLQVLQPSQGPSSSPLPISTNATNSLVNQTIVPDKAILPTGDIYSTGSSSDVKQAQGSTNLPDDMSSDPYTSSDSFRSIDPTIVVIIGILGSMLSLTLILVLLYAKHCKPLSTTSPPVLSLYNNDHGNIGMSMDVIRNHHSSTIFHLDYSSYHPSASRVNIASRTDSGIDPNVIESLPLFPYSALKGIKDGLECAVCLSKYQVPDTLRLLPACKHAFHLECVDLWLLRHSTCPLCRHKVELCNVRNSCSHDNLDNIEELSSIMCTNNAARFINACGEVVLSSRGNSSMSSRSNLALQQCLHSASQHMNDSQISYRATSIDGNVEFYVQERDVSFKVGDDGPYNVEGLESMRPNHITCSKGDSRSTNSSSWRNYIKSDDSSIHVDNICTTSPTSNGARSSFTKPSRGSSGHIKGVTSIYGTNSWRSVEASDIGDDDQDMSYYALMRNITMSHDRFHSCETKWENIHDVLYDVKHGEDHITVDEHTYT